MLFLVVDDDALSRELLQLLLEAEGQKVEAIASGDAAVWRIASCAAPDADNRPPMPDVILADIQMPGLAGDALAKALRSQLDAGPEHDTGTEPSNRTVLLAMSGTQPAQSELTNFDGFLLKPFTVSELSSMVERAAQGSRPQAAGEPEDRAEVIAAIGGGRSDAFGSAHWEQLTDSLPDALDEEIYARMHDLMPVSQLGQMYTLCVDDARKRIARMGTLAGEGNDAEYRKEAHAVKGGSGMIGASEIYALAAAAEQEGLAVPRADCGTTSVTATLARLSLACDRLERILQVRMRE